MTQPTSTSTAVGQENVEVLFSEISEAYYDAFHARSVQTTSYHVQNADSTKINLMKDAARAAFIAECVKNQDKTFDDNRRISVHESLTKSIPKGSYFQEETQAMVNRLTSGVEAACTDKAMPVEVRKVLIDRKVSEGVEAERKQVAQLRQETQAAREELKALRNEKRGGNWLQRNATNLLLGLGGSTLLTGGIIAYEINQGNKQNAAADQALLEAAKNNTEQMVGAVNQAGEGVEAATMEGSENIASQVLQSGKEMTAAERAAASRVVKTLKNGVPVELLAPTDSVPAPKLVPNN